MVELKNPGAIEFEALIQGDSSAAWVDFPFDLKETYGKGNLVPFIATFDGRVKYQGSLAKMGGEQAMLLLRQDIRQQISKQPGEKVQVRVELDDQPRTVEVPTDFQVFLEQNPAAKDIFANFAYTHRKEYVRWIEEAKKPETRQNRIEKAIMMISRAKHL